MRGWKAKGWRKADGKPVMNLDLLIEIDEAIVGRRHRFEWVKGHANHPLNEAADSRARAVSEAFQRNASIPSGPGWVRVGDAVAAPARPAPNALQEADLVGPRHLAGGIPFYACNAVDLGRRAAACELQPNKSDAATAASLVRIWGRLGIPERLTLDNWLVATLHHALPGVAWLCLALGVIPVFVPVREPWRQGVIEHFNDTFDKRFFRTERFPDIRHCARQLRHFEAFHDTHHRYAAIGRATPAEFAAKLGFAPRLVDLRRRLRNHQQRDIYPAERFQYDERRDTFKYPAGRIL